MITTRLKKKSLIVLIIFIALVMGNAVFWAYQKEGFYGDEIYSYAFVCSTDECSVNAGSDEEPYLNNWHDSDYFLDYFTITDAEAFDVIGVVKVIWGDDHPPMFDMMLEFIISLFSRNIFSKWTGISLNLFFFLGTIIVVYLLAKALFESEFMSIAVMCIYGFSIGAVSNCIFIRMYMMLTFATVLLTYINVIIIYENEKIQPDKKRKKRLYVLLALTILFGMTTQYYFSIYCGMLCICVGLMMILKKRWRYLFEYVIAVFSGLLLTAMIWPETYRDLFGEDRAKQAISNLSSQPSMLNNIKSYLNIIDRENFSGFGLIIVIIIVILGMICLFGKNGKIEDCRKNNLFPILFIALCLYIFMIARLAPMQTDRYIFNSFPLIIMYVVYLLWIFIRRLSSDRIAELVCIGGFCIVIILGYSKYGVNYVYKGDMEKVHFMEENKDIPVIMITADNRRYFSCVNSYYVKNSSRVLPIMLEDVDSLSTLCNDLRGDFLLILDKKIEDRESWIEKIREILSREKEEFLFETEEGFVYNLA